MFNLIRFLLCKLDTFIVHLIKLCLSLFVVAFSFLCCWIITLIISLSPFKITFSSLISWHFLFCLLFALNRDRFKHPFFSASLLFALWNVIQSNDSSPDKWRRKWSNFERINTFEILALVQKKKCCPVFTLLTKDYLAYIEMLLFFSFFVGVRNMPNKEIDSECIFFLFCFYAKKLYCVLFWFRCVYNIDFFSDTFL